MKNLMMRLSSPLALGMMLASSPAWGQSSVIDPYSAVGKPSQREMGYGIDDVARVDPFTGRLQIQHVDATIEGVGPTIALTRYYNSIEKLPAAGGPILPSRTNMANGWQFHPPYIEFGRALSACGVFLPQPQNADIPIMTLSDGQRHAFYVPKACALGSSCATPSTSPVANNHDYISSSLWVADCVTGGFEVHDPAGNTYKFTRNGVVSFSGLTQNFGYQLEEIEDPSGNTIAFNYQASPVSGAPDELTSILASDGREMTFTYTSFSGGRRSLTKAEAKFSGSVRETWDYFYSGVPNNATYSQLDRVEGPEGLEWSYTYVSVGPNPTPNLATSNLETITAPYGATKTFEYTQKSNPALPGIGPSVAVSKVTLTGPDLLDAEWEYSYSVDPLSWTDTTTIETPISTEVHEFTGERVSLLNPPFNAYATGYLRNKKIFEKGTTSGNALEEETIWWSVYSISDQLVPTRYNPSLLEYPTTTLLFSRTITRDGRNYTTVNEYDEDHLQVTRVLERLDDAGTNPSLNGAAPPALPDAEFVRTTKMEYDMDYVNWRVRTTRRELVDLTVEYGSLGTFDAGSDGTVMTYDSNGRLDSMTALGKTVTYDYKANGLLDSYEIPGDGGEYVVQSYDVHVPTEITSTGRGSTVEQTIDSAGYVASYTDAEGNTTTFSYDDLGRPTSIDPPRGSDNPTTMTYSFSTRQRTETRGTKQTTVDLDGLGREILRTVSVGGSSIIVKTEYDEAGRVVFKSDPSSSALSGRCVAAGTLDCSSSCEGICTAYDTLGRPTMSAYTGDGSATSYEYLDEDVERTTNDLGQTTTYYMERFGDPEERRIKRIEQEEGVITDIELYREGTPATITSAGADIVQDVNRFITRDERGLVIAERHPEEGLRRNVYDTSGRLSESWIEFESSSQLVRTATISYEYDAADRLISHGPGNPGDPRRVTATYDLMDRYLSISNASGTRRLDYDANGNITSEELEMDGRTWTVVRGYDGNDALNLIIYPSGRSVSLSPDGFGRPTRVGSYVSSVRYNANGTLDSVTYGNGDTINFTPDTSKPALVGAISSGSVIDLSYDYDGLGNVTSISDGIDSDHSIDLRYDDLNRLTWADGGFGTIEYDYNTKNARTEKRRDGAEHEYTYGYDDSAGAGLFFFHRLQEVKTEEWTADLRYDNRGYVRELSVRGLRARTRFRFDSDWMGRPTLLEREERTANQDPRLPTFTEYLDYFSSKRYQYDGNGYRVREDDNRIYFYDATGVLLYHEDGYARTATDHIHLGRLGVAEVEVDCKNADASRPHCSSTDLPPSIHLLQPKDFDVIDGLSPPSFEAVAIDGTDGDISADIEWYLAEEEILRPVDRPGEPILVGTGRDLDLGCQLSVGFHRLELHVSDSAQQETTRSVRFSVDRGRVNTPPKLVGAGRTGIELRPGQTFSFGPVSDFFVDPDGDPLTVSRTDTTELPEWLDVTDGVISGTVPTDIYQVAYALEFVAADCGESSPPLRVTVTMKQGTRVRLVGGPNNDTLVGTPSNDTFLPSGGVDTMIGGAGNDIYIFDDTAQGAIEDESGYDTVIFEGVDPDRAYARRSGDNLSVTFENPLRRPLTVYLASEIEEFWFTYPDENTVHVLTEADLVVRKVGTSANNIIDGFLNAPTVFLGHEGDDSLRGSNDDDRYVIRSDWGTENIQDDGGDDVIELRGGPAGFFIRNWGGQGIGMQIFSSTTGAVLAQFGGQNCALQPPGANHCGLNSLGKEIETIEYSTGSTLSLAGMRIQAMIPTDGPDEIQGTFPSETIEGLEGDDILRGACGRDLIYGDEGEDTLSFENCQIATNAPEYWGGPGDDELQGGSDSDWYHFDIGDGVDTISSEMCFINNATCALVGTVNVCDRCDPGEDDRLIFASGIDDTDLEFRRVGDDLEITVGTAGDMVIVTGWFDPSFSFVIFGVQLDFEVPGYRKLNAVECDDSSGGRLTLDAADVESRLVP